MTNIFGDADKLYRRRRLVSAAKIALEENGWEISRAPEIPGRAVFRIDRGNESRFVSVRTTQDQWFAFLPKEEGGWKILDEVDYVIVATVDNIDNPEEAHVYMFEAEEVRSRFDKCYGARREVGQTMPFDRGMWVSLFEEGDKSDPRRVGGGIAIGRDPILKVKIKTLEIVGKEKNPVSEENRKPYLASNNFSIADAKRRLSESQGVDESKIRITIEA